MARRLVLTLLGTMSVGAAPMAGPPIPYGQWSVSNGDISAQCTSGVECGAGLSGKGMLQREISGADQKYFQSIITNSNATGTPGTLAFSSESFVRQGWASSSSVNGDLLTERGAADSGIALRQTLFEAGGPATGGGMNLTTEVHTGWADDSSTPTIAIEQQNGSPISSAQYTYDFRFLQNQDANGNVTGVSLDLDQLGENLRTFDPIRARRNTPDVQYWVRRRRGGDLNPGAQGGFTGGGGGDNGGGRISLPAGANIQVTWFGAYYNGEEFVRMDYQSYDNLDDTQRGTRSWTKEDGQGRPFNWDNVFGAMPVITNIPRGNGD